jgi:hypothetical protein
VSSVVCLAGAATATRLSSKAQFEKGVAHDLTARLCKFDQRGVVDFRLPGEPLQ